MPAPLAQSPSPDCGSSPEHKHRPVQSRLIASLWTAKLRLACQKVTPSIRKDQFVTNRPCPAIIREEKTNAEGVPNGKIVASNTGTHELMEILSEPLVRFGEGIVDLAQFR